jgi:hypothetical protein
MKVLIFTIVFTVFSMNSYATNEAIIEVIQPNMHENGIAKTHTTYSRMIGHPGSSYLSLTFAKNSLETTHGRENRNIASKYNLNFKILSNPFSYGTIDTELILPENIKELETQNGYSMERVLTETIDCLVQNASIFYSGLDLKISGDKEYSKFEKVYSTKTSETREKNKYLSIQVKSFPIEEMEEALVFFNSFRETGLMTFLEKGIVNKKEFLRIKIGYFDNMKDAELTGHILKKIKGVDFFITNFNGTVTNYNGMYKIINTPSGIWARGRINEKEIYNFVNETNLNFEQKVIDISYGILKFNLDEKEVKIKLQEITRTF